MMPHANHEPQQSVHDAGAAVRPVTENSLQTAIQRPQVRAIARSICSMFGPNRSLTQRSASPGSKPTGALCA